MFVRGWLVALGVLLLVVLTFALDPTPDAARLLADQQRLAGADAMGPARQVAEQIERRAAWRERHAAALQAALAE